MFQLLQGQSVSTSRTTGHLRYKQDLNYLTDDLYIQNQQPELKKTN
jgi:hypothetical protein